MQVEWKWCNELSKDNLKHKLYIARNLWGRSTTPLPIVHYLPLCKDYIQMSLSPGILKWESQNWDSYCPKTLIAHIFFKSSIF